VAARARALRYASRSVPHAEHRRLWSPSRPTDLADWIRRLVRPDRDEADGAQGTSEVPTTLILGCTPPSMAAALEAAVKHDERTAYTSLAYHL
jgi:hypothetical protein